MAKKTRPPLKLIKNSEKSNTEKTDKTASKTDLSVISDDVIIGGRALDVIWFNPNLTPLDKLLLHAFASELNYKGNFREWRYMSLTRFAEKTGISRRHVTRIINGENSKRTKHVGLIERKFLLKKNCEKDGGKNEAAYYRLSDRIFKEYNELTNKQGSDTVSLPCQTSSDTVSLGVVTQCHQPSDTMSHQAPSGNSFIKTPSIYCEQFCSPENLREAKSLGMTYISTSIGNRIIPKETIHGFMTELLKDYGIEVLRAYFDELKVRSGGDQYPFKPAALRADLQCWLESQRSQEPENLVLEAETLPELEV